MKYHSIIRGLEYENLQKINLEGKVLDVGGSKKSGYHELIGGSATFDVVNLDQSCEPDYVFDIEKPFPISDQSYDHAVCLNVLEHVYEFENTFSEQVRCIKPGGMIVIATPFMHHIHASPDDYMRYTQSSFERMAKKYNCEIVQLTPLGFGLFSLIFQSVGGSLPTKVLQATVKSLFVSLDKFGNKISKRYRRLTSRIPLGYFVVMKKHESVKKNI